MIRTDYCRRYNSYCGDLRDDDGNYASNNNKKIFVFHYLHTGKQVVTRFNKYFRQQTREKRVLLCHQYDIL